MGHFTTIGDLEVLSVVRAWLDEVGMAYDISPYEEVCLPLVPGSLDWRKIPGRSYSSVVFICGPMVVPDYIPTFFARFSHCAFYGVNLSMGPWLKGFAPFKKLWPRDDGSLVRPDLSLLYSEARVPVVGVCLIHPQAEYGGRQKHALVGSFIEDFLSANDFAVIRFDTEAIKSRNISGLTSINAISSLIRCCDVVITTRLHGMVLSLKQSVPALAIDTISGGAKVLAQARALGWPHAVQVDELSAGWIETHFHQCLLEDARRLASECVGNGRMALSLLKGDFQETLRTVAQNAFKGADDYVAHPDYPQAP